MDTAYEKGSIPSGMVTSRRRHAPTLRQVPFCLKPFCLKRSGPVSAHGHATTPPTPPGLCRRTERAARLPRGDGLPGDCVDARRDRGHPRSGVAPARLGRHAGGAPGPGGISHRAGAGLGLRPYLRGAPHSPPPQGAAAGVLLAVVAGALAPVGRGGPGGRGAGSQRPVVLLGPARSTDRDGGHPLNERRKPHTNHAGREVFRQPDAARSARAGHGRYADDKPGPPAGNQGNQQPASLRHSKPNRKSGSRPPGARGGDGGGPARRSPNHTRRQHRTTRPPLPHQCTTGGRAERSGPRFDAGAGPRRWKTYSPWWTA